MQLNLSLLIDALRHPETVLALSLSEWDLLVRQARCAGLLARLAILLKECGLLDRVPKAPHTHLLSAQILADKQQRTVRWEVDRIQRALRGIDTPIVFLKGVAYVVAGLPPARGRLFSDVDIMTPKKRLDEVEKALILHGWQCSHLDAYDQHYYRKWMHELPPLTHSKRQTVLDVHHTILPETARLHPDPEKLLAASVPINGDPKLRVLAPADMVLHSATHLFHDGELENGLRDLVDLDDLLRHFGKEPDFWARLTGRAAELDLGRPLYYALRYTSRILDTPVPDSVLQAAERDKPTAGLAQLMDTMFSRAFDSNHPSREDMLTGLSCWLLYVRSHYLRMPLHLLIPHLARKAFRSSHTG